MIYLIEDKTARRNDYGWTDQKLSSISDVCIVIENASRLQEYHSRILAEDSIIIYHESFINSANYDQQEYILSFEKNLRQSTNLIVYFSGSKSYRKVDGNICNLPPHILYSNLLCFVKHYREGEISFDYLLFGENPMIEQDLFNSIRKQSDLSFDQPKIFTNNNVLFCVTHLEELRYESPFINATPESDFDLNCEDEKLMIKFEKLLTKKYEVIYIPLCFGEVLSDYLGLRLAMIIRLSDTPNKFTPIFIYGEASYESIIVNECASILCMPGIKYIPSSSSSFKTSINNCQDISPEEFILGLKKIHLSVPTDIGDNHSVANKWGIYRWSYALNQTNRQIDIIRKKISNNLYFRYLLSLYPSSDISPIDIDMLRFYSKKSQNQPSPKILYIDDEADDGWLSLLEYIIKDINNIPDFESFGDDLKQMQVDRLVSSIMKYIEQWEPNIVILDFRLHPSDFNCRSINNISGYKVLEKIKKYNRGIQVIVLSATNKIWNLQALQEKEANGFILKELPENSTDPEFTSNAIHSLISSLHICSQNTMLCQIWTHIVRLRKLIDLLMANNNINEAYGNQVHAFLKLAEESLFHPFVGTKRSLANPVIQLFRILEITSKEFIYTSNKQKEQKPFFIEDHSELIDFDTINYTALTHVVIKKEPNMPQKICNIIYKQGLYTPCIGKEIVNLIYKRNDFIHSKKHKTTEFEFKDVDLLLDLEYKILNSLN